MLKFDVTVTIYIELRKKESIGRCTYCPISERNLKYVCLLNIEGLPGRRKNTTISTTINIVLAQNPKVFKSQRQI